MFRTLITLLLLPALSLAADSPKGIAGLWYGVLKIGAIELRMGFQIEKQGDKLTAKLHSVDQGDVKIPMDSVAFADGQLTIKCEKLKLTYLGRMQDGGNAITGELDQGVKFKFDLTRTATAPTNNRPQLPKKPYPYVEEPVTFSSKAASVKLAGTLTKPKGDGPFPVAVLISGSGPQDRDETLLGHKPFLVLADHLTRQGIAVLRYDDRGVAESTGVFETATSKDFADDATGAVAFLKGRKEIGKIGLIGHSEGGLIAPLVAAGNKDVGFIVLLAGPGLPGDEIVAAQSELILSAMGETKENIARGMVLSRKLFAAAKSGATAKELEAVLLAAEKELTDEKEKKEFATAKPLLLAKMKEISSPWYKFFLGHDPRPVLAQLTCPILAINGSLDLQVPCQPNLDAIRKATKGNKDVTTTELKGLNHLFQPTKTGLPSEYGVIEETFAPAALDAISSWLLKRIGK